MNPIKEYKAKIKSLERKRKQLEEKVTKLQEEKSVCSKERSYLKQRLKAVESSRTKWKAKLKVKQEEFKELETKIKRLGKAKGHHYPTQLVGLCILLRIIGGCSYGGVVRILGILNVYFGLGLSKLPCENTIQNWVSKLGLFKMKMGKNLSKGKQVSLIIDESIRLGQEKLLLILSIPFEKIKQGALSYEDVEVVYMKGALSWTGEKISEVIENLKGTYGFGVKSIISDEDSKLLKACRLSQVAHLPDISHAIATCLKKVFEKTEDFKSFKTLIGSYASKGVNQALSYLCPPKQRTKARFMNLSKVVNWVNNMLKRRDKLNETEKKFFNDLSKQADFVEILRTCLAVAKAISLPFKLKGLSKQSLRDAQELIFALNPPEGYVRRFLSHFQVYLTRYQEFIHNQEAINISVSSEVIESMFGKYKSKANNYALTGLTSLNLELPIYGMQTKDISEQVESALEAISIANLVKWKNDNATDSQLIKRKQFFKEQS